MHWTLSSVTNFGKFFLFGVSVGLCRGLAIRIVGPERMRARPVVSGLIIGFAGGIIPGVILALWSHSLMWGVLWLGLSVVLLGPPRSQAAVGVPGGRIDHPRSPFPGPPLTVERPGPLSPESGRRRAAVQQPACGGRPTVKGSLRSGLPPVGPHLGHIRAPKIAERHKVLRTRIGPLPAETRFPRCEQSRNSPVRA